MSNTNIKYGFIKPAIDAHTMGISSVAELLAECGYEVVLANDDVEKAINEYKHEARRKVVVDWIASNNITKLGLSYRLDEFDAINMIGYLIEELKRAKMMKYQGGQVETIFFGGLPNTCKALEKEFKGLVETFIGGESARETLLRLGVPEDNIPLEIQEGNKYDETLLKFGKEIIDSGEYLDHKPIDRSNYPEYGTKRDTVTKRIDANMRDNFAPLIRAHVGPYSAEASRIESVNEFLSWVKTLAKAGYLDILSIGSSQLSQSNFGEDWTDLPNGGGVPINSRQEYQMIYEASRPLLVRTYAGTKNIPELARMYEEDINISWHALSLWWFNKLDERGPYDLYTNLKAHIDTIKYIGQTGKPFEANVSHHFAFRGADDVTYIVAAYLCAKLAKKCGVKTYIVQNMLNTPRLTWGIQDLAKSRALLSLIKTLEDNNFRVLLQPRAGLDYFKPDLYEAKIQLAAVTALMDDILPLDQQSPHMIHVVSYSEASHLATPDVINESVKITQHSLMEYRKLKKLGNGPDMSRNEDIDIRQRDLYESAKVIINAIESSIKDPYTPEGFYKIFAAGFLPVPYLWKEVEEFKHAKDWRTKPVRGGIKVVDKDGNVMTSKKVAQIAMGNLKDAEYNLAQRVTLE
ncbi:MAG: cobalamin B12-binding domain-containing protein [Clostridiales bacterium]|nr:cobalamin B12-binding domain-containing protein [Clostridiales bacterium]